MAEPVFAFAEETLRWFPKREEFDEFAIYILAKFYCRVFSGTNGRGEGGSPTGLEKACSFTPSGAGESFRLCRSMQTAAKAENLLIFLYFVP